MTPGDEQWTRTMTASKVAAVLGLSPWQSPYSLWMEMSGRVNRPQSNDAQRRGTYLEAGVLAWWRDQHKGESPWAASVGYEDEWHERWTEQPEYALGDWAAATPDAVAFVEVPDRWEAVLVEAKTAARSDDWGDPGTDDIPAYYYAQVTWQMHVSGIHTCYIPVLTGGLRFAEYVVHYDPANGAAMERMCRDFYDSLAGDVPPDLDDSVATFDTVKRAHPDIDRGESVELDRRLARGLVLWCDELKVTEKQTRHHKSRAIEAMGRAQYATCDGVRIARRQPRGDDVTFVVLAKPEDLTESETAA